MTAKLHLPTPVTPSDMGLAYNERLSTRTPRLSWQQLNLPRKHGPAPQAPVVDDVRIKPEYSQRNPRTGFYGVKEVSRLTEPRYEVYVQRRFVGTFADKIEAARAHDDYVIAHGLNKRLNFADERQEAS